MKRTILVFVALAAVAAPVATAGGPEQLSPAQRIIHQEDARKNDPALVGQQPIPDPYNNPGNPNQNVCGLGNAQPSPVQVGPDNFPATIQIVDSGGFHWGDAGIGAAVLAAVMLVLTGTFVALRAARPRRA